MSNPDPTPSGRHSEPDETHPVNVGSSPSDSLALLQAQYQSLRVLINAVLICLIILTGSLFVFLLREVSLVRPQLENLNRFVAEYNTRSLPTMERFRLNLEEFAQEHPDFRPILQKYFTGPNSASPQTYIAPVPPVESEGAPPSE